MTTSPQDMTPVEIDRVLSENYQEQMKIQGRITSEARHIDRLKARFARGQYVGRDDIDNAVLDLESLRQKLQDTIAASAPYEMEYSRRPWNRYFLVTNGNGHVHRGMNCSTCFRTTQYSWLIDLADCDENAMIEEWGERACTVCFPTAPVNPLYNRPARIDREAQEARQAEKQAREAAKAEKAITDVDGSPLRVGGDLLKTKVAARNALSSAFQDLVLYGASQDAHKIRKLVSALEAAGVDWKKVPGNAIKRAVKESVVPPNNPFRLTPEQIAAHEAEIKDNAAYAQLVAESLAQEVQS